MILKVFTYYLSFVSLLRQLNSCSIAHFVSFCASLLMDVVEGKMIKVPPQIMTSYDRIEAIIHCNWPMVNFMLASHWFFLSYDVIICGGTLIIFLSRDKNEISALLDLFSFVNLVDLFLLASFHPPRVILKPKINIQITIFTWKGFMLLFSWNSEV